MYTPKKRNKYNLLRLINEKTKRRKNENNTLVET